MPGEQIEDQEFCVAEPILDIVAEDPQEQHVAEEMHPAAMHEHGGEDLHRACHGALRKLGGDECPLPDKGIACGELEQEHRKVQDDEGNGDDRSGAPLRVVVTDREHASLPFARGLAARFPKS